MSAFSEANTGANKSGGNGGNKGGGMSREAIMKREISIRAMIAYPALSQPEERSGAYQGLFIVDPESEEVQELKDLLNAGIESVTGEPQFGPRHNNPLRDGDEMNERGGYTFRDQAFRGKLVFRAKSKFQPKCIAGRDRQTIDPSEIRGGDHVIVAIGVYPYSNQSTGVGISLNAVWLTAQGERPIERGGAAGSSFTKVNMANVKFSTPKLRSDEGGVGDLA